MKSAVRKMALKRLIAWLIDCGLLLCYVALLFVFVSPLVKLAFTSSPFSAEATGFVLLTLPFWAYLCGTEALFGKTVGKYILHISVTDESGKRPKPWQIIMRNTLKLLPWELAHFSIWHAFMFEHSSLQRAAYITLMASYGLVIWYVFSLFIKEGRTPYDKAASVRVR